MALTTNQFIDILKHFNLLEPNNELYLSQKQLDAITFKVQKENCDHLNDFKTEDIHFHRHEMICLNCNKAIGFINQFTNEKIYYDKERKLDESTRNKSNQKTLKGYEPV